MAIKIQTWKGILQKEKRDTVFDLYKTIFEQNSTVVLEQKWVQRMPANGLTLVAFSGKLPIGYKIGFELDKAVFYSWLGGVLPEFRGQGAARLLLEKQHAWCCSQGYRIIRTKTLNRWKNMLRLNLEFGFDIVNTYTDSAGTLKIVLEKYLKA